LLRFIFLASNELTNSLQLQAGIGEGDNSTGRVAAALHALLLVPFLEIFALPDMY